MRKLTLAETFPDPDFLFDCFHAGFNKPYPKHTHEFTEINIVLNGTTREIINGEERLLKRGDVIVLTGEDTHETVWAASSMGFLMRFDGPGMGIDTEEMRKLPGYNALFVRPPSLHGSADRKSVV